MFVRRVIRKFLKSNLVKLTGEQKRYNNKFVIYTDKSINELSVGSMEEAIRGKGLEYIVNSLRRFAGLNLAEPWDNVGLLVDPMVQKSITNILLTNDLTEKIVNEAVELGAGLIVTYHPNIFEGIKSVNSSTWKQRIVVNCIKNEIAVYSPHTTWDSVQNGVNDWLARALPISKSKPINVNPTNPYAGSGRICELQQFLTINDAVARIKKHIGLRHIRVAKAINEDMLISVVAVCAGSGSSILKGINADLYLTGEMSHHDIFEAVQNGKHVVLCEHSNSERGFLKEFKDKLQFELLNGEVTVHISKYDRDPIVIM